MSTPHMPRVEAGEAERIELPGGWYFKRSAEKRWVFDLCSPAHWRGTLYMGSDEGVAAFAAALNPAPAPQDTAEAMAEVERPDVADLIAQFEKADRDWGMRLIRLVDGVETYEARAAGQVREFDNTDDLYEWIGQVKRAAKERILANAMSSSADRATTAEAALASLRAEREVPGELIDDDVEWIVNDLAELGVKIRDRFFFCYKGESLAYVSNKHDDTGKPMKWRRVFKREFGECIHPIDYDDPSLKGTVSLDDSDAWQDLPAMPEHTSSSYRTLISAQKEPRHG